MPTKAGLLASTANDLALHHAASDPRLDTGMRVSEAVYRARLWWDGVGRKDLAAHLAGKGPDDINWLPSGILCGAAWDDLDKREKLAIAKCWHHMFVRRPDKLGVDPEQRFKLGNGGETVQ